MRRFEHIYLLSCAIGASNRYSFDIGQEIRLDMLMKDEWIRANDLRIHYLTAGEAGAPVLLLHGGALDTAYISYKYSIEPIAQHFKVFAPDLPGHGGSDKPNIEYSNEFYIEFIKDFMDALGLERASLVGLSASGASALGFALQFPERTDKLVLADTYGLGGSVLVQKLAYLMARTPFLMEIRWAAFSLSPEIVRLGLRNIFYDPGAISDEVVEEIFELAKQPGEGMAWLSYLRSEVFWDGYKTNYMNRLNEIAVPTLIIHCAHDQAVPVELAKKAHGLINGAELKLLAKCAHWPLREQPDEFNQAVLDFLLKNS
jgi:pimeloyl-ACP methyl ester carboxylesterase